MGRLDAASLNGMSRQQMIASVGAVVSEIAGSKRLKINQREQASITGELVDDMIGLGPLEPLMADDSITDIMVNGPNQIYVERKGKLTLTDVTFRDDTHLLNAAQRIASSIGRRVDESSPMVDARLADGSRVNIIIPPLSLIGPVVSIRKFPQEQKTLDDLIPLGSLSPEMAAVLKIASASRLNIIISGGTGAGKTTMMNALSYLISGGERIVTIEDAAELRLQQPHVISLETRPMNFENQGQVTQRDLVRNALRMRPDRIIIGECRGAEAFDMLQAMNTGHDGSMSTIHANTPRDAISRLENMLMMGESSLPLSAIRRQIVSAVNLIVQVERMRDGVRRTSAITEVMGLEGDIVVMQDLFRYEYDGEGKGGILEGRFVSGKVRPKFAPRAGYFGLEGSLMEALR